MIERVEVDERDVAMLVAALRAESDGSTLNREFADAMREVAEPAAAAARASVLSMATSGLHHPEPSLRGAVAAQTKVQVHLSGRHPSVAIRVAKTGMPRGFSNAPKRLNSRRGWRHPAFGTGTWVTQRGKAGWFDDSVAAFKPEAERKAAHVLDNMAQRISDRTKG